MPERRVILIGKTGNGKSSTGNSILGYQAFAHETSPCSVTQCLDMCANTNPFNNLEYVVLDTPGLLDTDVSLVDRLCELHKAVETIKEPHAFLLVFNSSNRFSKDEAHTVKIIELVFGKEVFEHCIIVFTEGNKFKNDIEFEKFYNKSDCLKELIQTCEGRVVRIENKNSHYSQHLPDDISCLLKMIETVSEDGERDYQYLFKDSHKEVFKNYAIVYNDKEEEITTNLANISRLLCEALKAAKEKLKKEQEIEKRAKEKCKEEQELVKRDKEKKKKVGQTVDAAGSVLAFGVVVVGLGIGVTVACVAGPAGILAAAPQVTAGTTAIVTAVKFVTGAVSYMLKN